jgi:hypothetical protein
MDYDESPLEGAASADSGLIETEGVSFLTCPSDMRLLQPTTGAPYCINIQEEGAGTWLDGEALCASVDKRYCKSAEWEYACNTVGTELDSMVAPDPEYWEWVQEVDGTSGHKFYNCTTPGTHAIDDGDYGIRCCSDPN